MDKPNKSTISPVTIIEELKLLKLEPRKPVIKPTIKDALTCKMFICKPRLKYSTFISFLFKVLVLF